MVKEVRTLKRKDSKSSHTLLPEQTQAIARESGDAPWPRRVAWDGGGNLFCANRLWRAREVTLASPRRGVVVYAVLDRWADRPSVCHGGAGGAGGRRCNLCRALRPLVG